MRVNGLRPHAIVECPSCVGELTADLEGLDLRLAYKGLLRDLEAIADANRHIVDAESRTKVLRLLLGGMRRRLERMGPEVEPALETLDACERAAEQSPAAFLSTLRRLRRNVREGYHQLRLRLRP